MALQDAVGGNRTLRVTKERAVQGLPSMQTSLPQMPVASLDVSIHYLHRPLLGKKVLVTLLTAWKESF